LEGRENNYLATDETQKKHGYEGEGGWAEIKKLGGRGLIGRIDREAAAGV
jgi:hypothetical protein